MIKPLILIAALSVPAAAFAAPAQQSFERDGETFVYSVSYDAAGRTVLDGTSAPANTSFHYVIDGRQVTGWTGNQRVSFQAAKPIPRVAAPAAVVTASK